MVIKVSFVLVLAFDIVCRLTFHSRASVRGHSLRAPCDLAQFTECHAVSVIPFP
jgi:hypothetical protein